MTIWEHLRIARHCFPELSREYVVGCRRIYQMGLVIEEARKELAKRKQRARLACPPPETSRITDEMIERAREYPVCSLIEEFPRGRAKAWCHDDHTPSLYYGSKKEVAVCPVCSKTFDAIAILMERDGYTFAQAVRQLS